MVDSTSGHQTGLAVWTRQVADSHGVMTINSQASYWWIAVNINRPGNKKEEEGEEGRGGEGRQLWAISLETTTTISEQDRDDS